MVGVEFTPIGRMSSTCASFPRLLLAQGNIDEFPFLYGAPTYAAEAMRMMNFALVGGKTVETVTSFPPSTPNQYPGVTYRPAFSIRDGAARRFLCFVNDGVPGSLPPPQIALGMNLAAWGLPTGTLSEHPPGNDPFTVQAHTDEHMMACDGRH